MPQTQDKSEGAMNDDLIARIKAALKELPACSHPMQRDIRAWALEAQALIRDLTALPDDKALAEALQWMERAESAMNEVPLDLLDSDIATQIVGLLNNATGVQARAQQAGTQMPPRELSDHAIVTAVFKTLSPEQYRNLVYTKWRDGIDVDYPTVELRRFSGALLDAWAAQAADQSMARGRNAREAPSASDQSSDPNEARATPHAARTLEDNT